MKALALKYRPKNFNELVGQDIVANSLSRALNTQRLGHAYLFSGLRGSGKTSSARIFSKALLCENGISSNPCEHCKNCVLANQGRHLDIIEMDAASHRKIDDIRELIEFTKYSPSSARFKIFIIDEVHMLTKEAFNALLKTLEEPPSYVKFILATTDPLRLPATILSRTQHFRFRAIAKDDILKHLEFIMNKEKISYEIKALEILSRSGSGSLRDTLTLLEQAINFSDENVTQKAVTDMLGLLDPSKIEEILETIFKQDKDAMLVLLKNLNLGDVELIIDEIILNLKDKFINQNSKFSILIFERFFRILSKSKSMLSNGADAEFVVFLTMFMMIEALNLKDINDAIKDLNIASKPHEIQKVESQVKVAKSQSLAQIPYQHFVDKIYDRDFDLGKCFDECIEFVELKDNILFLNSSAKGLQQTLLQNSSKLIMQILRECFDKSTKIKIERKIQDISPAQKLFNSSLGQIDQNIDLNASNTNLEVTSSEDDKLDNVTLNSSLANNISSAKIHFEQVNPDINKSKYSDNSQDFDKILGTKSLESTIKDILSPTSDSNSTTRELKKLFGEPEIIKL